MAAPAPATATTTTTRAHALLIPYPCSGHINPTLHFARLLHSAGVLVTFVNTEHNHALMVERARGRGHAHDVVDDVFMWGFRYVAIPDGLAPSSERGAQDHYSMGLLRAVVTHCAGHLRALIVRLNSDAAAAAAAAASSAAALSPVTCVVASELMSFALDVAADLGLPSYMLWGTSACGLACGRAVGELRRRGHVPLKGNPHMNIDVANSPS
jgi:hypothetical protein